MKVSYAVTVCDEFIEIQRLINHLLQYKKPQDEIVVLVDLSRNEPTSELLGYLHKLSSSNYITLLEDQFNGHFADWKNKLTSYCKGDYIFQIDADEVPCTPLIESLPSILESNPELDVMLVPRVNTVEGLTQEHIQKWNWNVNSEGWVNWPDFQWRVYKNTPEIKWVNKVHERLEGFKTYTFVPPQKDYAIVHEKTIEKQRQTNLNYNKMFTDEENRGYNVK